MRFIPLSRVTSGGQILKSSSLLHLYLPWYILLPARGVKGLKELPKVWARL